jgi:hypothetical protein
LIYLSLNKSCLCIELEPYCMSLSAVPKCTHWKKIAHKNSWTNSLTFASILLGSTPPSYLLLMHAGGCCGMYHSNFISPHLVASSGPWIWWYLFE